MTGLVKQTAILVILVRGKKTDQPGVADVGGMRMINALGMRMHMPMPMRPVNHVMHEAQRLHEQQRADQYPRHPPDVHTDQRFHRRRASKIMNSYPDHHLTLVASVMR